MGRYRKTAKWVVLLILLAGLLLLARRPQNPPLIFHSSDGTTALHVAAQRGQFWRAQWLLWRGAPVDAETLARDTPLIWASRNGHVSVVRVLLKHGADIHHRGMLGRTPLHNAVISGQPQVVDLLLRKGADVNAADARGDRPLHVAINENRRAIARLLLGANPAVNATNALGETPLMRALKKRNEEIACLLIDAGADVNQADFDGYTPVQASLMMTSAETLRRLCEHGADPNVYYHGRTPLHDAVHGLTEHLIVLLRHGANLDAPQKNTGQHPLHWCGSKHAELLLAAGADPDGTDFHKATPLHWAAARYMWWNAKALLDYGARIDARDMNGLTPLNVAQQVGDTNMVALLLRRGARELPDDPPVDRVTLTYISARNVTKVGVYGTLNGWRQWPLAQESDTRWRGTFSFRRGQYLYQFVVDDTYVPDPANPAAVRMPHTTNPFSLLETTNVLFRSVP